MSGVVETEAHRPRPLSGGLWTLFSWLRRDEHSSSESLSSVGSDRTAASFAFLAPAHYATAEPVLLPPPGPPTDSYKKRVRDRNLRRQHDRDITLHRKYGLYGFGYDAFSLPNTRRVPASPGDRCDRGRRATSESLRAHVPGKRRAPLPPSAPTSLNRRRARKRPAPPPPVDRAQNIKQSIDNHETNASSVISMNRPLRDEQPSRNHDNTTDCKPEKYSKKDGQTKDTKDVKIRHEKSFLRQIFESKKRNSAIETASVKLLPSISELDKQAADIIEKYRLKELTHGDATHKESRKNELPGTSKQQMEAWICTRCLRRYNASVITCDYCLPLNKTSESYKSSKMFNNSTQTNSKNNCCGSGQSSGKVEDKEKLKEMLKEMKDSLPKRPKNDLVIANKVKNIKETDDYPKIVDAPTLRIGSTITMENKKLLVETSYAGKEVFSNQLDSHENKKEVKDKNPIAQSLLEVPPDKVKSSQIVSHENKKEQKERNSLFPLTSPASSSDKNASVFQDKKKELATINSVLITQPVVFVHTKESNVVLDEKNANKDGRTGTILPINSDSGKISGIDTAKPVKEPKLLNMKYDLNTPLKISSLLNPIYIPKSTTEANVLPSKILQPDHKEMKIQKSSKADSSANLSHNPAVSSVSSTSLTPSNKDAKQVYKLKAKVELKEVSNENRMQVKADDKDLQDVEVNTNNNLIITPPLTLNKPSTSNNGLVNQHTRRRDLINQLEQSIAKGDEHAAAEAAVKLAQLRLSCSVLSFSSQIVAEAAGIPQQVNGTKLTREFKSKKVEEGIQTSSNTNTNTANPHEEVPVEKIVILNADANNDKEKLLVSKKKEVSISNAEKSHNTMLVKIESSNKSKLEGKSGNITENNAPCEASTSKGVAIKKDNDNEDIPILVWVEDKETTRGPVQLYVQRTAVMGELRKQAEKSLGLAARMQRWIVGRSLCSDDNTPLVALAGTELTAPFYLCLVESDPKEAVTSAVDIKVAEDPGNVYNELVKLEQQPLVSNTEVFECGVCIEECPPGSGVVLRECVHSFCKECLSDVVRHSEEPIVACPAIACRGVLQEREIRGLVSSADYEKWLARGLAAAENGTRNAFHCRTRDCTGWALCEPGVQRFPCPVCKRTNCVPCQAIHEEETCEQHQSKLQESAASPDANQTDEGTRALLNTLISRGEALECPECSTIITKKWGCDWVKCSACKTEICWVTKGRRWGPAGRGDTSGGCRCGVDGKRCHPSCGYCH